MFKRIASKLWLVLLLPSLWPGARPGQSLASQSPSAAPRLRDLVSLSVRSSAGRIFAVSDNPFTIGLSTTRLDIRFDGKIAISEANSYLIRTRIREGSFELEVPGLPERDDLVRVLNRTFSVDLSKLHLVDGNEIRIEMALVAGGYTTDELSQNLIVRASPLDSMVILLRQYGGAIFATLVFAVVLWFLLHRLLPARVPAPVASVNRTLWWLGGADVALLEGLPAFEKQKFRTTGFLSVLCSGLVSFAIAFGLLVADFSAGVALTIAVFAFSVFLGVYRRLLNAFDGRNTILFVVVSLLFVFVESTASGAATNQIIPHLLWGGGDSTVMSFGTQALLFLVPIFLFSTPLFLRFLAPAEIYNHLRESGRQKIKASFSMPAPQATAVEAQSQSDQDTYLETQLEKAVESDPSSQRVIESLLELKLKLGKNEDSLRLYDRLIRIEPENIDVWQAKANFYQKIGDQARYLQTLSEVESIKARGAFLQNRERVTVIKALRVKGLAFFGDFTWTFQPHINVLLGRNGYGKSHILRALVSMLQANNQIIAEFFQNDQADSEIQVVVSHAEKESPILRRKSGFEQEIGKVPVLAIPDMRFVDKSARDIPIPSEEWNDLLEHGSSHFLHQAPYTGLILSFLYGVCGEFLKEKANSKKADFKPADLPIIRFIQSIFKDLTGSSFTVHAIELQGPRFRIDVFTEGNETTPMPIQKASQGTLSVVAMFGLIYNYLRAVFPNVEEEALLQKHAIVVIDEIDAHLHPTWQQQVLCLCAKRFPNIQFIVAAHSPLVVGGCGAGEAAVLSREGSGFVVKVLPRHFIGATTEEMYREVFKVEQLDSTYKELEALYPKKMEIESQIQALKQKGQSGPELQQLIAQSQGIVQFEEVKEEKDRKALIENENQKLRGDAMDLRARIRRLTDQVSSLQASDEAMLVEIRATMHRDRGGVGLVGGFADGLRKAGRLSEALALVGEAVNLQPDNEIVSKTFEEVLTNFGDHDEAIRVLEGVMKTIGGNKVLQQAVARLKSTGTSESKALEG